MRLAILDDVHDAYRRTEGYARIASKAEVEVFTNSFGDIEALRGFDALLANRERTKFTAELLGQLSGLGIKLIIQTGGHANHIDLPAAEANGITIAKASGGSSSGAAEL